MAEIVYAFEVGTRDKTLSTNRLSRAYALLATRCQTGKEFGFSYRFFNDYSSNVENSSILGDSYDRDGADISAYALADRPDEHISEQHQIIPVSSFKDLIGIVPEIQSIAGKYNMSISKILQGFAIGESSTESLSILLDNLSDLAWNTDAIGQMLDVSTADNKDTIVFEFDAAKLGQSDDYRDVFLQNTIYSLNRRETVGVGMSKHYMTNKTESITNIDRRTVIADNYQSTAYVNYALGIADNRENEAKIYRGLKDVQFVLKPNVYIDRTFMGFDKISNSDSVFNKAFDFGDNFSKEMKFDYAKAYNKINNGKASIEKDIWRMVRNETTSSKLNTIQMDRAGKQNGFIDRNILDFDRGGNDLAFVDNGYIKADKHHNYEILIESIMLGSNRMEYNASHTDKFMFSELPNRLGFDVSYTDIAGVRYSKDSSLVNKYIYSDRINYTYEVDTRLVPATTWDRDSVVRLYNIFNARIVEKTIFSDRDSHVSIFFHEAQIQRGQRPNGEGIIFVNTIGATKERLVSDLTKALKEVNVEKPEILLLIGLHDAVNKPSEMLVGDKEFRKFIDMSVTKLTANNLEIEAIVDLLAVGWGKKAHDTDDPIITIGAKDSVSSYAYEPVQLIMSKYSDPNVGQMHWLEMAVDISKKRNSTLLEAFVIMNYLHEQRGAIKHDALTSIAKAPIREGEQVELVQADWDTEWSELINLSRKSKDIFDQIKVPDDYDYYGGFKDVVFDKTTGEVKNGTVLENGDIQIQVPLSHYSKTYYDLVHEEIPVDLYVYKDMMLLIWIFWCKHRVSEKTAAILQEFYETENLDMTRLNEYSKIAQMDAPQGINYVIDNVYKWIKNTIAVFDAEKMGQYERVMKQARWFGEKIAIEYSKFIITKEYENIILHPDTLEVGVQQGSAVGLAIHPGSMNLKTTTNNAMLMFEHEQPVKGEILIDAYLGIDCKLSVFVDGEEKVSENMAGFYRAENPGYSSFIRPAIKLELQDGVHDVKILIEGKPGASMILGMSITNAKFKRLGTRYEAKQGTGAQAVDRLLNMMKEYYELHHTNKAKGVRTPWTSN